MPGISTNLIVKNCAPSTIECLTSLLPFLRPADGDEIVIVDTGSTDGTPEALEAWATEHAAPLRLIRRPDLCVPGMLDLLKKYLPDHYDDALKNPQFSDGFLASFAAARQIALDASTNPVVFWIDSDDILLNGAALRDHCASFFADPTHTALFLPYDYSFDTDGGCNTVLWRERVLLKAGYHWVGACHESLIPRDGRPQTVVKCPDESCRISHKNGRPHLNSDVRNYAIMMAEYEASDWKDPRLEFYLANALRGLKRYSDAILWYSKTLQRSGSRDDRLSASLNIGYCYLLFGRPWRAIDWFLQSTKIQPAEPRAFFGIARAYHELGRPQDCVLYSQLGRALPSPEHITAVDPQAFDFYPTIFETLALKAAGHAQGALQTASHAVALRPNFPPAKELLADIQNWVGIENTKAALQHSLSLAHSPAAARDMIKLLKPELKRQIPDLQIESSATPPKHSITFFCPPTIEPWDPTSIESGVGGSEKMVIQLARSFAARGWRVDVYGSPKPENAYHVFDKVAYRPVQSFNPEFPRDILILWRHPALLDHPFRANRTYVDMHDVATDADFTPARLARCDGVFFKSKAHRATAPSCPEDKCIYSRNGIDLSHFPTDPPARNPQKIVWTSSGDRGLLGALSTYARIQNEFPASEFHVFYGFTPLYLKRAAQVEYQYFGDLKAEHNMLDYMESCYTLMDRLHVHHHGRIGHKALAAELSTSGIWLYPTTFHEISCMSAMEAQLAGAFPICSSTGALAETVNFGTIVDPALQDQAVCALRAALSKGPELDTYRAEMQTWARTAFDLDSLVTSWLDHFTTVPTARLELASR